MSAPLVISMLLNAVLLMYVVKLVGERHESDEARAALEWEKMRGLREDSDPATD